MPVDGRLRVLRRRSPGPAQLGRTGARVRVFLPKCRSNKVLGDLIVRGLSMPRLEGGFDETVFAAVKADDRRLASWGKASRQNSQQVGQVRQFPIDQHAEGLKSACGG